MKINIRPYHLDNNDTYTSKNTILIIILNRNHHHTSSSSQITIIRRALSYHHGYVSDFTYKNMGVNFCKMTWLITMSNNMLNINLNNHTKQQANKYA